MYESYYGFKEKPFNLNSTPEFLYQSENYREILSRLEKSIRGHANFCILSGLAGTGKSMLCESLLKKLQSDFVCKLVAQPVSDQTNPLHTMLSTFGVQVQGKNDAELIAKGQEVLNGTYLEQKRQGLLIVDNAHHLTEEQIEQYASMMQLLTSERSLLTIVLAGKPGLIDNLNKASPPLANEELVLQPLTLEETVDFITQRLNVAEAERTDYFDEQAYQGIFDYCRGIPKLINVFCHITLEYGAVQRKPWLGRALIDNVAKDSGVAALKDVDAVEHADHSIWENMSIASNAKLMANAGKNIEETDVDEATETVHKLEDTKDPESLVFSDNNEQNVLARQIAKAGNRNGNSAKPTFTYLDKGIDKKSEQTRMAEDEARIKDKIREQIEEPYYYDDEPTIKNEPIDRTTLAKLPDHGVSNEYRPTGNEKSPRKNLPLIAMGLVIAGIAVAFGFVQLFPIGSESKNPFSEYLKPPNQDFTKSGQDFSTGGQPPGDNRSISAGKFPTGVEPLKNSGLPAGARARNSRNLSAAGESETDRPGKSGSEASGQGSPRSLADLQEIITRPIDRFNNNRSTNDDRERDFGASNGAKNSRLARGEGSDQVKQLLTEAQQLFQQRMLTTPVGGSALDAYQEILLLKPNHPEALVGIDKIKLRYIEWSEVASQRGELNNTVYYLEKASSLDPLNVKLLQALRDARRKQSGSAESFSTEPLGQARELGDTQDDRLSEEPFAGNPADRGTQKNPLQPTTLNSSGEQQPFVPPVSIANVSHKLLSDRDPSIVSIRAKIQGTIEKAEVLVSSAKGFVPYSMYDDATHGDSIKNDRIYHTLIRLKGSRPDTRFYIAAYTRTGGVIYSPNGADRETYRIRLKQASKPERQARSPVVINEFMASNNRTIRDPQGEYDGWIELYNTGVTPVDLSGYYLSDDPSIPKKWQFPQGTKVGAQQYLLIWADNQPSDTRLTASGQELHANFRLSRDGGKLVLMSSDTRDNQLVDRVRFGELGTDRSVSRVPNGTGRFNLSAGTTPGQSNNRRAARVRPTASIAKPSEAATTSLR